MHHLSQPEKLEMEYDECSVQLLFYTLLVGLLVKCMLRLACVLLYQGRFKSRRLGGSRISLRVRSILVTFCMYFCSSYIIFILVLCAMFCSFSTSNSLVFAFSQFVCVCMFVCVLCIEQLQAFQKCVDTRTCKISKVLGSIALRSARTLQSAAKKWHRTLLLSASYHAEWTDPMKFSNFLKNFGSSGVCV